MVRGLVTWLHIEIFMSFFIRVPFLLFNPKLHVLSMGVWSSSRSEKWLTYWLQWPCKQFNKLAHVGCWPRTVTGSMHGHTQLSSWMTVSYRWRTSGIQIKHSWESLLLLNPMISGPRPCILAAYRMENEGIIAYNIQCPHSPTRTTNAVICWKSMTVRVYYFKSDHGRKCLLILVNLALLQISVEKSVHVCWSSSESISQQCRNEVHISCCRLSKNNVCKLIYCTYTWWDHGSDWCPNIIP